MRDFQKDTGNHPHGTLMLDGPHLARATKCTAAVLASPDSAPVALHNTHETIAYERIAGRQHEEGVDCPPGRVCHCVVPDSGNTFHGKEFASLNCRLFPRMDGRTIARVSQGAEKWQPGQEQFPGEILRAGICDGGWKVPVGD